MAGGLLSGACGALGAVIAGGEARMLAEFQCNVAGISGFRWRQRCSRPGGPEAAYEAACEDARNLRATLGGGHGAGIGDGGHGGLRHFRCD